MSKTNKVLWVLGNLSAGGVETWLKSVYNDLLKNNIELQILITNPSNKGEMFESFKDLGIQIYHIPYSIKRLLRFSIQFKRLLNRENFTIVHEHGDFAGCFKYIFILGIKKKLFLHIHSSIRGVEEYYFQKRFFNRFLWKMSYNWFKNSRKILSTSDSSLQEYGLSGRSNAMALYCSVRQEFLFEPDSIKDIDLLFIGRLDEFLDYNAPNNHKNSWFALNVMSKCLEKNQNLKCVFMGGPFNRLVELQSQKLPFIEKISFQSSNLNPIEYFQKAHVVIFPSAHEGLGLVAVEAQLQKCFVLASDQVPLETKISENIQYFPLQDINLWSDKAIELLKKEPSKMIDRSKYSPEQSSLNLKKAYESN